MRISSSQQTVYGLGSQRGGSGGSGGSGSWALRLGLVLALSLGSAGCGKSGIAEEVAAFKESGHPLSELADADPSGFGAKKCQTAMVDRLSVLLCEYADSDSAAGGQAAAEAWGTETATVAVLRRGGTLFAVADRSHVDPEGKNIAVLSRIFRRAKGR